MSGSKPLGLVDTVPASAFKTDLRFGPFTNCFTFMTGFDDNFMDKLGIRALRPEHLRWTELATKELWVKTVTDYFSPQNPLPQPGTVVAREGIHFSAPSVKCICFPKINGALDYHWAIYNNLYWLEQAGQGGPLNIWSHMNAMIEDIYSRVDEHGNRLYALNSAFMFDKRVE
ncbi:hypothetical protein SeLEV6574_g03516 [Synchytrium endobioticum]|uniref:Uncharacterized protein n=1 Tax=Synchytrium endobioticum TaxID=286115 RepID=A0A507D3S8_9FUNG|nr:hypothetical protein SeLEV6574_g03516 [Synchytrium endobioticum]